MAKIGRGDMIRTRDPLLPKQMLYQAELHPDDLHSEGVPCSSGQVKVSSGLIAARASVSADARSRNGASPK